MRKVDIIAGARPNFMKVAPILRALEATALRYRLVHTAQHYDAKMSDDFFTQREPAALRGALERLLAGQWKASTIREKWDGKTATRIVAHLERILGKP